MTDTPICNTVHPQRSDVACTVPAHHPRHGHWNRTTGFSWNATDEEFRAWGVEPPKKIASAPTRSWVDAEHTKIRCFQHVEGRHNILDIIEDLKFWCDDWEKVELNYSATWIDTPNEEEIEKQRQAVARSEERKEAWERKEFIRLTEKYGDKK